MENIKNNLLTEQIERDKRFFLSIFEVITFLAKELETSNEEAIISLWRIEQQLDKPIPTYKKNRMNDYVLSDNSLTDIVGDNPLNFDFEKSKCHENSILDTFFRTDYLNNIQQIKDKGLLPIDKKVIKLVQTLEVYKTYKIVTSDEIEKIRERVFEQQDIHDNEREILNNEITKLRNQLLQYPNQTISDQQLTIEQLQAYIREKLDGAIAKKQQEINLMHKRYEDLIKKAEYLCNDDNFTDYSVLDIENLKKDLFQANAKIEELEKELLNSEDNINTYKLINVMKEILLDVEITGYIFANSDNPNAKNKPSKAGLISYIVEKDISGLKERNLQKIFKKAQEHET